MGLRKKLEGVRWGRGGTEMMLDFNVQRMVCKYDACESAVDL